MKGLLLLISLFFLSTSLMALEPTEVRLGYPKGTKLLIINADDFGMCHAENMGTRQVLEKGLATSATIMIPPAWSHEALKYAVKNDLKNMGVHVTLTSEWSKYRWRPLTYDKNGKSSLTDKLGYFWETSKQVEQNAKMKDVEREVRAQLDAALNRRIELSHFDSHMGSLYGLLTGRVELLAVAMALSYEYGLPFRLPKHPLTMSFQKEGFVLLDNLIRGDSPSGPDERREWFINHLKNLKPGLTELYIHPSVESDEIKNVTGRWKTRKMEMELFSDPETHKLLKELNIVTLDYQKVKELQRKQMGWRPTFHFDQVYQRYLKLLGVK